MEVAQFWASRRGQTTRFTVHPNRPLTLGRSSRCSVRLRDPKVSRIHCRVEFERSRLVVRDMGSSHGILYRGQSLREVAIDVGDGFHVGETFVRYDALASANEPDGAGESSLPAKHSESWIAEAPVIHADTAPQPKHPRLAAGTMLGRFVIEDGIGQSDRCVVYRCRQVDLGRRVALKVMHGSADAERDVQRESFLADVRTAASVTDPLLVPTFDVGSEGQMAFAVLELVAGQSLATRIEGGRRMSWRELTPVLVDVAKALERLHERGLIHGGVKSTNVFLTEGGGGRLADPRSSPYLRLNEERAFAAPKQRLGVAFDARADLYGLGAIAYAALRGEPPPSLARAEDRTSAPSSLLSVDSTIPEDLDELIRLRLLAIDPAARPADASEVLEEILLATGGESEPAELTGAAPPMQRPGIERVVDAVPAARKRPRLKSFAARLCADLVVFTLTLGVAVALILFCKKRFGWNVYDLIE